MTHLQLVFAKPPLLRHFQEAAAERLSSQLFWNQINRISETSCAAIRRDIFQGAVQREGLSLESICYDGTNFYTLIDAFNAHCHLPRRGKNQQDFALIDSCDPSLQA